MQSWILSVAGIAVLSVLADIILPLGQTKKYIKTVIGIAITLATVQPLISVFSDGVLQTDVDVIAQQNYLNYVEETYLNQAKKTQEALYSAGFLRAEASYNVDLQKIVVAMNEKYSEDAQKTAQDAIESAKIRCSVGFVWDDG